MIALEEVGIAYSTQLVAYLRGDHRTPEFLARNPAGQVPVLVVDGRVLTENLAILFWLNAAYPQAGLMPKAPEAFDQAQQLADLGFCSAGLHPLVTRIRLPQMIAQGQAVETVKRAAMTRMSEMLQSVERRLGEGDWWYGKTWSIMDAYLNWVWFRIRGAGFPVQDFPNLTRHEDQFIGRPSVARTIVLQARAQQELEAKGLAINFDSYGAKKPKRNAL